MSEDAQKPRKIPQAVLNAQAALETLRGEDAEKAAAVEKILPVYAIRKEQSGETVTTETLLEAARQGADYLQKNTPSKKTQKDAEETVFETYARLTGRTAPANDDNRTDQHDEKDTFAAAAARGDNAALLSFMENGGKKIKAQMHKAVKIAARAGQQEAVQILVDHGATTVFLSFAERGAFSAYKNGVEEWQKAIRTNPPPGLHNEDPRFFKKNAFDTTLELLALEDVHGETAREAAFRLTGLLQSEQRVLQYLKQWGDTSEKQPLLELSQQIALPKPPHVPEYPALLPLKNWGPIGAWLYKKIDDKKMLKTGAPNMKDWGDAVLKCGPSMAKLVKFSNCVTSPEKSSDGKTWSTPATRAECAKHLYKQAMKHPELAELCYSYGIKEEHYNAALKLIEKHPPKKSERIPDITIDGEKFDLPGAQFRRLPSDDVRGLFLGKITACCQSIGGTGEGSAKHGYLSEHGGFYVVESSKGSIIGQSWAWRGKKGELCFDSLETLGDRISPAQWTKLMQETAKELTARKDHDVTALHIGAGGRTPEHSLRKVFRDSSKKAQPKGFSPFGHRDSRTAQIRVWKRSA